MNLVSFAVRLLATEPLGPGDEKRSLRHDGRNRSYIVHIPPKYDAQPTPVVLAFHGAIMNASLTIQFTGLNEKADKEGFIVVYPNGTGWLKILTWNGGNCCGYARHNNVDDVGFIRSLLDDLATVANVDAKRVFATGISNGAVMCYRLASELSDRIAAIAPVSGPMGTATCNPQRPVPVMHFHGTQDTFAPFNGGKGTRSVTRTRFFSVEHSIMAWVKADGCPETPVITDMPKKADDGTTVRRKTYGPGKEETEVVLFVIDGGGHTWPGRDTARFLGTSTHSISANDLMWEFFQRHPMK
jgi:polyhydroxybutyrate depolymerase